MNDNKEVRTRGLDNLCTNKSWAHLYLSQGIIQITCYWKVKRILHTNVFFSELHLSECKEIFIFVKKLIYLNSFTFVLSLSFSLSQISHKSCLWAEMPIWRFSRYLCCRVVAIFFFKSLQWRHWLFKVAVVAICTHIFHCIWIKQTKEDKEPRPVYSWKRRLLLTAIWQLTY